VFCGVLRFSVIPVKSAGDADTTATNSVVTVILQPPGVTG